MPHRLARRRPPTTAFTLTELLITIGIIVLLIGILIPTVNKMRQAALGADTQNTMGQLNSAITRYHQDFSAYPGPLSNAELIDTRTFTFTPKDTANPDGPGGGPISRPGSATRAITASENLSLALLGGLMYANNQYGSVDTSATFAAGGPRSLNPRNPKKWNAYMGASEKYLSVGLMNKETPHASFTDTEIPEFVDSWPQGNRLPIIYARATAGAAGTVSDANDPATPAGAIYQYDLRLMLPYLRAGIDGLRDVGETTAPVTAAKGSKVENDANALVYLSNANQPPTNRANKDAFNGTGTPYGKDQFILIAAGRDRVFGTSDDITSWGGVK